MRKACADDTKSGPAGASTSYSEPLRLFESECDGSLGAEG